MLSQQKMKLILLLTLFVFSLFSLYNSIQSNRIAKENNYTKEFIQSIDGDYQNLTPLEKEEKVNQEYDKTQKIVSQAERHFIVWGVLFLASFFISIYLYGKLELKQKNL